MKQRGIANPQTLLVAVIVTLVALGGLVFLVNRYENSIREAADKAGYDRGKKEQAEAEKASLQAAQKRIGELVAQREADQAAHLAEQARLKAQHDEEVANAKAEADRVRDCYRTGKCVLRDPGAKTRACGPVNAGGNSSGSATAGPAGAPAGGVEAGASGLSPEAAGFLLSEADRANELRADLKLCWGIARDDRRRAAEAAAKAKAGP